MSLSHRLLKSIQRGQLTHVQYLISTYPYLIEEHPFLLRTCATQGHLHLVRYLIETVGLSMMTDDASAFWGSADQGQLEIVRYFIEQGINIHHAEDIALQRACGAGHLPIVKCLLEHGADLSVGHHVPLRKSAYWGHHSVVSWLIQCGADIHVFQDQAIYYAAAHGHLTTVQILLQHGALVSVGLQGARWKSQQPIIDWIEDVQRSQEERASLLDYVKEQELLLPERESSRL